MDIIDLWIRFISWMISGIKRLSRYRSFCSKPISSDECWVRLLAVMWGWHVYIISRTHFDPSYDYYTRVYSEEQGRNVIHSNTVCQLCGAVKCWTVRSIYDLLYIAIYWHRWRLEFCLLPGVISSCNFHVNETPLCSALSITLHCI